MIGCDKYIDINGVRYVREDLAADRETEELLIAQVRPVYRLTGGSEVAMLDLRINRMPRMRFRPGDRIAVRIVRAHKEET